MEVSTEEALQLLLDLLNSSPTGDGAHADQLLGASGSAWLLEHGGGGSRAELDAVVAAREVLQRVVRGATAPTALSPLLAGARAVPSVSDAGVGWALQVDDEAQRLAQRAVLAWDAVHRAHPGRLRECANADCARFLLDRSRAGTARWCSMAVCGNRMKARRHHRRSAASTG